MELSDGYLLQLLKKGNEVAFKQLYDRHWKRLYLFALRFLGTNTDAKDVVQEVFLVLWTKQGDLDIRDLGAYLYSMTKNKCLAQLGKRKLDTTFLDRVNLELGENNVEKDIHFKETQVKLEKGIDLLPSKTKEIFKLSRYDELSNQEIAHRLNISIKTVEYHITQSIRYLRLEVVS